MPDAHLRYFAYGSNLSLARLRARVPSARRLGSGALYRHELRFHKAGRDGSAKCDAWASGDPGHAVHGALFAICPTQKYLLDRAEGLGHGYAECRVRVRLAGGAEVDAFTYRALRLDDSLQPYSWYLDHVLIGARESGLPEAYIRRIEGTAAVADTDRERDARERAIHAAGG